MRCGRCCTQFAVCVTPFDIVRIAKAANLNPLDSVQAIPEPPARERNEPAVLIDGQMSLIVLAWKSERVCTFYSPAGCTIYPHRPLLCRTYPFVRGLQDVRHRACPEMWAPSRKAKRQYLADLRKYNREVKKYTAIAKEWNSKGGGSLAEFVQFILTTNYY